MSKSSLHPPFEKLSRLSSHSKEISLTVFFFFFSALDFAFATFSTCYLKFLFFKYWAPSRRILK